MKTKPGYGAMTAAVCAAMLVALVPKTSAAGGTPARRECAFFDAHDVQVSLLAETLDGDDAATRCQSLCATYATGKILTSTHTCRLNDSVLSESAENYTALAAAQKLEYLWGQKILPTEYLDLPSISRAVPVRELGDLAFIRKPFYYNMDESSPRAKLLHASGTMVRVRLEQTTPLTHRYTGLFGQASIEGLARLSLNLHPSFGYSPGMALKLFTDGSSSVNIQAMVSLDGQGNNRNFFALPLSNQLPLPASTRTQSLAQGFTQITGIPNRIDINHIAAINQDGSPVSSPRAPRDIVFQPTAEASGVMSANSSEDFRQNLARIRPGTVLYTVFVKEAASSELVQIGVLKTASRFVASRYGDRNLLFKHNNVTRK